MSGKTLAVVVNWNGYHDTTACVEQLRAQTGVELSILVVDNGSTDGSVARLRDDHPDLDIVCNETNEGFAGGINAAIERTDGSAFDFVWILNNDVRLRDDRTLRRLISQLDDRPDAAGISPLIEESGTGEVWFWHGFVDWAGARAGHTPADRYDPDGRFVTNDYIPLTAALFRSECVHDTGPFSDRYFLYYEDVDFCTRLREDGYELLTDTATVIEHDVSGSSDHELGPVPSYYLSRNRWLLRRSFPARRSVLFYPLYAKWLLYLVGKQLKNGSPEGATALLSGTIDGVVQRDGRGRYP